MEMSSG